MFRKAFLLVSVVFFASLMQAQTADEIVDKHLEAIGGKELLSKIQNVVMKGSTQVAPGQEAPVSITIVQGKALRFELTIQGMTMVNAVNGDKGWKIMPFQGKKDPEPMTPDEILQSKDQLDATGDLYNYKSKGNQVELVGTEDMEGTEVYKLKVTKPDGNMIYHYIDTESYLDLKQSQKIKVNEKEMDVEQTFSNYKKTDFGVTLPFAMGGMMGEMKWNTIEINTKVDNSIFNMPGEKAEKDKAETKPGKKAKKEKKAKK